MKPVTKAQLSKIHVLLSQMQLLEEKGSIVSQFTKGRAPSSKYMTADEARELLIYLSRYDPCDKMRRKVFALAYEAGIIWGDTPEDKKMNGAKLDAFMLRQGAVKKKLNLMNKEEITKVLAQFEQVKKHIGESKTNKGITAMLASMNIQTLTKSRSKPI